MRTHLEMQQLVSLCGGAKAVADKLRIGNPNTVYQWTEDPERSGRYSPMDRVMQLCRLLADEGTEEGRIILLGMLREAIGCLGYTVVKREQLDQIRLVLDALAPGAMDEDKSLTLCPRCHDAPLEYVAGPNIFHCRVCGGR